MYLLILLVNEEVIKLRNIFDLHSMPTLYFIKYGYTLIYIRLKFWYRTSYVLFIYLEKFTARIVVG